jgi:hypothetical protein
MRRWLTALALATVAGAIVAGGWAYYVASSTSGSAGGAKASSLPTGNTPTVSVIGRNVTVTWAQNSVSALGGLLGAQSNGGYTITRYAANATSTAISPGASCSGSQTGGADPLSCTENNLPTGRWKYTATPTYYNWSGGESSQSASAIIPPANPSSVTLVNGGGVGSAYINNANKSSVNVDVALPATSLGSDTINLSISDGIPADTVTASTAGTTGSGTVHFTGLNLSGLTDGTLTFTATAQSSYGDNSAGSASNAYTKDTVAPAAPTSVSLSNGGGAGSAFINSANKASVNYNVVLAASSVASDTITFNLNDPGSVHTIGPLTKSGIAGGGTQTFNSNNLTSFNDGTITASATATDAAGNTSAATTTTNTKDTVAPAAPTSVALSNGGGTGSAFINSANKAGVNYSVALGSGSLSSDTITFNLNDAGSAHTIGPLTTAGTSGAGNVSFNGNNLSAFNDGTITASATATDAAGNTSAATTTTNTKDTVAPAAPTSVSLSNGGGAGSAFINSANKASVNYNVVLAASSVASDTITFNLNDPGSVHTIGPLTKSGIAGGGTQTFNSNNLTSFNDGTITASATATDAAGNTSAATTTTNTKDTVAPAAPTSVSIANGQSATGSAPFWINGNNKGSVNYDVVLPASANDSTSDTVKVTLTSGVSVSGTAASIGSAGGTVHVTGIDATTLTDGTVSVSATVTDAAGNASTAATTTTGKDTVAPSAPSGSTGKYTYTDNTTPTADTITGSSGTVASGDFLVASEITGPNTGTQYTSAAAASNGSVAAFAVGNSTVTVKFTFFEEDPAGNLSTAGPSIPYTDTK